MTPADPTRPQGRTPHAALMLHDAEKCSQCYACVRHCPARALRPSNGSVERIAERCVQCGLCVSGCSNHAHVVREDVSEVRRLLASGRPVVALLASESVAAMHPMTPVQLETALASLGFAGVETAVLGEELVASAYENSHGRTHSHLPRIRSTCPVAVEWVKRFHPAFTDALVPVVPPYVAQSRLIHELYPESAAVVYVSPCWSRKDEIRDPAFAGLIDVAIGFDELRALIEIAGPEDGTGDGENSHRPRRPSITKQLSATDGFPRRTLVERNMTSGDVAVVRGLDEIDRVLTAIARGETAPSVVDMLNCEGCIDGPCVNQHASVYFKRAIDVSERERQPPPSVDSRAFLAALPSIDLHRGFEPKAAPVRTPDQAEVDAVLMAGEFQRSTATIDCGACGYNTCVAHAVAIWQGNSTWEMCFPLQRKRLNRERERLEAAAAIDELTGLLNRRSFDQRIVEEIARSERYGAALSLVLFDVDGFKRLNDTHGHVSGDEMLRSIGVLLDSQLRAADAAVRYGGDEFALILPNTSKTEAWAVAEKVRSAISRLTVCSNVEEDVWVSTTVSIGVASLRDGSHSPKDLIAAADAAMYEAKRHGCNRVEIAAG